MVTQLSTIPESFEGDDDQSTISIITASSSSDPYRSLPSSPNTSVGGLPSHSPSSSSFGGNYGKGSTPEGQDPYLWIYTPNYLPDDILYVDGNLVGATMEALVEKLTPSEDPSFTAAFFLTFRLYCTPSRLAELLDARYKIQPPSQVTDMETLIWQEQKGSEVRQGVLQFTYTWLMEYWQPGVDDAAFPTLTRLTSRCLSDDTSKYTRQSLTYPVLNLLNIRIQGELQTPGSTIQLRPYSLDTSTDHTPGRRITRTLLNSLRKKDYIGVSFFNFDSLELARQLTLMESKLYCAISQDELLHYARDKPNSSTNIDTFEAFGTTVRHWVSESVLHELNIQRRAWVIGFFIKIADSCMKLNNFSTARSIIVALDSPVISRLHLANLAVSEDTKAHFKTLKEFHHYKEFRSSILTTESPSVSFVGLYLSSISFYRELYPASRVSPSDANKKLIDLDRHSKLAEILQDFRRFQIPYDLKPIPELQSYLEEVAFKVTRHLENIQILGDRIDKPEEPPVKLSLEDRKRELLRQLIISMPSSQKDYTPDEESQETTPTENTTFAKHQSIDSSYSSSVGTIYSNPHSSIGTLDYGFQYTRHAISQDSVALAGWQWKPSESESEDYI